MVVVLSDGLGTNRTCLSPLPSMSPMSILELPVLVKLVSVAQRQWAVSGAAPCRMQMDSPVESRMAKSAMPSALRSPKRSNESCILAGPTGSDCRKPFADETGKFANPYVESHAPGVAAGGAVP